MFFLQNKTWVWKVKLKKKKNRYRKKEKRKKKREREREKTWGEFALKTNRKVIIFCRELDIFFYQRYPKN